MLWEGLVACLYELLLAAAVLTRRCTSSRRSMTANILYWNATSSELP